MFAKNDRAFDAFWRQYITTQNGDHRRHIPLVGNIKQMLSSVFDAAVETDEIDQFNAVLKCFLSRMVGDSKGDDAAALAKHCLSVLASLRSHIFLGHGLMNHVIGDMAEMLRHREPAILNQIDAAKTMSEVQTRIENWSNSILSRGRQEQLQSVVLVSDYGLLDRGEVFEQALAQFRLVVDVLCVDNFSDVQEYKKEARAIVKNLRDSYATDLSDAGHDGLRWFQNKSWCGCHKTMIELIEQPSIDRLKHVLDHVYQIEVGFAERVSSILNGQGLKTTPTLFLMANTKELQQPEYASIRTAFEQLIGRHSSSLSSK